MHFWVSTRAVVHAAAAAAAAVVVVVVEVTTRVARGPTPTAPYLCSSRR
jgi:hypothetical protein